MFDFPIPISTQIELVRGAQFSNWKPLNDTIMGGSSKASCEVDDDGLTLQGLLIEKGGGFVSCRSPIFDKPLNLSKFRGFLLDIDGKGRTLKFAVACKKKRYSLSNFFSSNIRWVAPIPTEIDGNTKIRIPFKTLEPAIRAKPVPIPVKFDSSCVNQFQILYSKFGQPGQTNLGFKPGPIKILIKTISVYI